MGRLNFHTGLLAIRAERNEPRPVKGLQGRRTVKITASHREDPDPYGVEPLAADELRV